MGASNKRDFRLIMYGIDGSGKTSILKLLEKILDEDEKKRLKEQEKENKKKKSEKKTEKEKEEEEKEKKKKSKNYIPTIGFNVIDIKYEKYHFTIWDVGGQDKIRILWKHYYSNVDGIIYVLDSNDSDKFEENKETFEKLINEDELKKQPILIYANKQDMNGAYSENDIIEKLVMKKYTDRKWLVKGTSINNGEGIKEGFDWLISSMINKNEKGIITK